jgi:lipopolysaccharide assembly protein B
MEFEPWMLVLLPAFFAAGWFAARWDLRQTIRAAKQLPATYFQGINHLLHDEQDQALAALIDVVKQDPDTPELHFALGALYRRRGETDRAIRVHENLLSRRDLSLEYRHRAQLEVGLDYVKAGLLKQAEAALNVLEGTPLAVKAEEQRIRLAQSERDWPLAIQMAKALRSAGHATEARYEMQFHASIADEALAKTPPDVQSAKQALQQAAILNSQHARVSLLQIKLARLSQDRAAARVHLDALAQYQPEFLSLAASDFMQLHGALESKDGVQMTDAAHAALALAHLQTLCDAHPSIDLAYFILRHRACAVDAPLFAQWAAATIARHPSPRLLQTWLTSQTDPGTSFAAMTVATEQLALLNAKAGRFTCKHCRFQARQHYWQCPGCAQWESYAPQTE